MSLDDWLRAQWVTKHKSSPQEIADLLAVVDRDLKAAATKGLDNDWRLTIGYNAALQCATAALAASGFRASREGHHHRVIQSLVHTIAVDPEFVAQLDAFRKKRNIGDYERAGLVSNAEADEMIALAAQLRALVKDWLRHQHPELLSA